MAKQKVEAGNVDKKISELKIEMLKQVQKRKSIKREIARLMTMNNIQTKISESPSVKKEATEAKTQTKLTGAKK